MVILTHQVIILRIKLCIEKKVYGKVEKFVLVDQSTIIQMPGFDNSQRPPQGPRRTKSLPSKYMIPSEDIGQYEAGDPNRRRSAPPQAKV